MAKIKVNREDLNDFSEAVTTTGAQSEEVQTWIDTGITLLNCALSDNPFHGWAGGKIGNVIGDSHAGKTVLAFTTLASACYDPKLANYRKKYDDAEEANEFDMRKMFGKLADEIEPPWMEYEKPEDEEDEVYGIPVNSETIEDFQFHIHKALKEGEPFIYILDSFDSIYAQEEMDLVDKIVKAAEEGKEVKKGSYHMQQAKKASQLLRQIRSKLRQTDSLLLIISQTRDNVDSGPFAAKNTRSGGRALKFYSTYEMWMTYTGAIKRTRNKRERTVGSKVKVKITKNKITGKVREIEFPIYYDYGIDDIQSCVEFMIGEGFWTRTKGGFKNTVLKTAATKEKIISEVEQHQALYRKLRREVGKAWKEIEDSFRVERPRRFS